MPQKLPRFSKFTFPRSDGGAAAYLYLNPGPGPWSSTMLIPGPSDPSESLCHHSDSKPDMASSPIPNADVSGHNRYPNTLRLWVQIISSAEKRTRMVERISMFLRTFAENTELETIANSMLRVSIQTSFLHSEILLAVGTMQRRMATYVLENCRDQMMKEVLEAGQQTLDGTHSELQRLEMIFSELRASISLVILSSPSTPSLHTQTGSLEWIERLIFTIRTSRLILDNYINFGNGLGETYPPGIVSIAPCILGCSQSHSPPLRGGDFHDAEARRSPTIPGLAWRRQ